MLDRPGDGTSVATAGVTETVSTAEKSTSWGRAMVSTPPDWEANEYFWRSGELMGYYHDWKFEYLEEKIFDCGSSGIPHQHCMDVLIARKV